MMIIIIILLINNNNNNNQYHFEAIQPVNTSVIVLSGAAFPLKVLLVLNISQTHTLMHMQTYMHRERERERLRERERERERDFDNTQIIISQRLITKYTEKQHNFALGWVKIIVYYQ